MIGIDTNVLLRLATADDAGQVSAIRRWLAANAPQEKLFVNRVVLVEAVWALKTSYGVDDAEIALFIDALLDNPAFVLEDEAQVADALSMHETGRADFADCLIVAGNLGRCEATLTFDRALRGHPGTVVLAAGA